MSDGDPVSWFDDPAAFEAEVRAALAAPGPAPVIPGYGALRELARGGQGVVHTAFQVSTRRTVAIKVLREGLHDSAAGGGTQARLRFEREVELAASLQHRNVVGLFDSGTLADGRPFLVMELVDGPTIEHAPCVIAARAGGYRAADVAAVVAMFAEVCDGVAYAHRRGVVHRDLKPSNLRIDAEGTPKVLDFGLAKQVAASPADPGVTVGATGAVFVGSLPWASPEQALGRVRDIDVRSDVYALGVVLHQLLAGRFPYPVEGDLPSALDAIVNAEPERLRRVASAIPTDLETIVLRCLQKDPERRYQSAGELAGDLRRFLAGDAIEARRDSALYVLRRIGRRHRAVVAAIGLTVAALVIGGTVALVQWRRAEAGRREAVESARRADAAMRFFADTLVAVDPDRDGADVKVLDLVERAAPELKNRFADDPDTQQYFYTRLVELLRNLGQVDRAERLAAEALAAAESRGPLDHPDVVFCRANHALLLHRLGRSAAAVAALEPVAAIVRRDPARYAASARHVFANLGNALLAVQRIDAAEAAFLDAERYGSPASDAADTAAAGLEQLAAIAGYRGDHARAIELLRAAVARRTEAFGAEHSSTLRARSNLAFYLADFGSVAAALAIMQEDVAVCRRRFGDRGLQTLSALNNRGNYYERLGDLDAASRDYEECLAGRLEVLGTEHPHTAITLGNVAGVAMLRGDFERAETSLRQSIEIGTRLQGGEHADVLVQRNNLALVVAANGDRRWAVQELRDVVGAAARTLGAEHVQTALFRVSLARQLAAGGDTAAARAEVEPALRVLEQRLAADADAVVSARELLESLAK